MKLQFCMVLFLLTSVVPSMVQATQDRQQVAVTAAGVEAILGSERYAALRETGCGESEADTVELGAPTLVARCTGNYFAWDEKQSLWRHLSPALEEDEHVAGIMAGGEIAGKVVLYGSRMFVSEDYGKNWTIEEAEEIAHPTRMPVRQGKESNAGLSQCFAVSPLTMLVGADFSSQSVRVNVLRSNCGGWREVSIVLCKPVLPG